MAQRIVITGTGLVCPAASSVPGLLRSRPASAGPAVDSGKGWFDPVPHLGPRGWRYLSPATRYLLAAARLALADAGLDPALLPPDAMGVVVGTNFGAQPVVDRMDHVVITAGADELSPAEAPNFSVNLPASHISMRYAMRAFNLSLTNPMVAGLEALLTLTAAIRRSRARLGIAGATEERPAANCGEGSCCFVLERLTDARARGHTTGVEIAGGLSRIVPPDGPVASTALARPLAELMARAGTGDLQYASVSTHDVDATVEAAAAAAGITLLHRRYLAADGSHFTVSGLLQVAGLIAEHGHGLVTATSPHGHVAAVLLRPIDAQGMS